MKFFMKSNFASNYVPIYWYLIMSGVSWNIANLCKQFDNFFIFSSWFFGKKHFWPSCGQKYVWSNKGQKCFGLSLSFWTCLGLLFYACTMYNRWIHQRWCQSNKIWQHRLVVHVDNWPLPENGRKVKINKMLNTSL